jgi:hypothetical protein
MKHEILFAIFDKDNRVESTGLASIYVSKSLKSYLSKITNTKLKAIGNDLEWELNNKEGFISTSAWGLKNYPPSTAVFKINYKNGSIKFVGTV